MPFVQVDKTIVVPNAPYSARMSELTMFNFESLLVLATMQNTGCLCLYLDGTGQVANYIQTEKQIQSYYLVTSPKALFKYDIAEKHNNQLSSTITVMEW